MKYLIEINKNDEYNLILADNLLEFTNIIRSLDSNDFLDCFIYECFSVEL